MRGWRLATVCGHVGVPLFRRHSNGFEVPPTMDDHVDRVAVRKKITPRPNGMPWLGFGGFPTLGLWTSSGQGR